MLRMLLALAVTVAGYVCFAPESEAFGGLLRLRAQRAQPIVISNQVSVPFNGGGFVRHSGCFDSGGVQRLLRLQQARQSFDRNVDREVLQLFLQRRIGVQQSLYGF